MDFFIIVVGIILIFNLNTVYKFICGKSDGNNFIKVIFKVYITLLVAVVYFPIPIAFDKNVINKPPTFHLIPWESTIGIYKHSGIIEVITNLGGNLILLTPFLFFICYYFSKLNLKHVIIIAFLISLFIECSQVTLSCIIPNLSRAFDTMDLICNTISGVWGYCFYNAYEKDIIENVKEVKQ